MSTRTGKGKKRKRIGRLRDKKQSEAFMRAAKEMGLDQSGEAFDRAMDRLAPKKPRSN